jgi:uncharacterized repeat protein (TIGR03803 family)
MKNIHPQPTMKLGGFEPFTFWQPPDGKSSGARRVSRLKAACALFLLCAATALTSAAATKFKSLDSFNLTDGLNPDFMSVVQGLDGNLYGTTVYGGVNKGCNARQVGCGTVFSITPGGKLTTLHSFCSSANCTDGAYPVGGLTLATDGNFYGTTSGGGTVGFGIVFKITTAGKLSTVYNFCSQFGCPDGRDPNAPPIQGTDGNLYGVTVLGGTGGCGGCHGGGIAYKLTRGGTLTVLHNFCTGTCTDGFSPSSPLVQATDGNFYGVITGRSGYYDGNAFKMTPSGRLTVLYAFCNLKDCTDGAFPYGSLTEGADGALYGTTSGGGAVADGGSGTFYKITKAGVLTTLHSFDYTTKGNYGALPLAGLVLGTDGNFYGTTYQGGMGCVFGCGTVFKITPKGALTTLYLFGGADGAGPYGLFQDTRGSFYGATNAGGTTNQGTLFSVSVGLGPFVELLPNYSRVGKTIDILGQGLTGTTAVSFNGSAATFTVVSDTYLTAVVPPNTIRGSVTVTTPGGKRTSNTIFRVAPVIISFSPPSGPVGQQVTISGNSFTGATRVTFGGVKATVFSVDNDAQITATVPSGAVTGRIQVTTRDGTATSSTDFTVTQ